MVLTTYGVSVKATRTLIINNESLTSITEFGFLDGGDDDITTMSSHMAHCVSNNGCVIMGGIQIKKIQALSVVFPSFIEPNNPLYLHVLKWA